MKSMTKRVILRRILTPPPPKPLTDERGRCHFRDLEIGQPFYLWQTEQDRAGEWLWTKVNEFAARGTESTLTLEPNRLVVPL
jgi:hypothetical protein